MKKNITIENGKIKTKEECIKHKGKWVKGKCALPTPTKSGTVDPKTGGILRTV